MSSSTAFTLTVLAAVVLQTSVVATTVGGADPRPDVDCLRSPNDAVAWLGLDNFSGYDIKIRTCQYDQCSGNPAAPNAYYDCPKILPAAGEGSENTTWLFSSDVKMLIFVFKSGGAPQPLGYELKWDASVDLAITKDALFRECETDTDCPKHSYCQTGAGKTPPFLCHGATIAEKQPPVAFM